jgi:hypothetical protein
VRTQPRRNIGCFLEPELRVVIHTSPRPEQVCVLACDGHHKMSDSVVPPVNRFAAPPRALRQCRYISDGMVRWLDGEDHEQDQC